MSKKVTKMVQKEETVTVCDTCSKELGWNGNVEIDIDWYKNCPRDNCYEDWGEFNFCSYECFDKGVSKLTEELDAEEDFHYQSFTIRVSGVGEEKKDTTLSTILKNLAAKKEERNPTTMTPKSDRSK